MNWTENSAHLEARSIPNVEANYIAALARFPSSNQIDMDRAPDKI